MIPSETVNAASFISLKASLLGKGWFELARLGSMWVSSWHNFATDVTDDFSFPEKIELYDWTLEGDGEEMPGMVFTSDERKEIAQVLDAIRVPRIAVGMISSSSPEETEAVREIAHLGLRAKVETYVRANKRDIDIALKSGVSGVQLSIPPRDFWKEESNQYGIKILDQCIEAANYAKEHGLSVTFGLADATRADEDFLARFVKTVDEQSNVDAISLADSWGVASPDGLRHMIKMAKQWTKLPIAIHCHNDLGLATANALAGLAAGASIVTTTINGIGERSGLTSLEEVAVALRILHDIDVGIRYDKLCELSRAVEKATGPLISTLKPVVGERAFAIETDEFVESIKNSKIPAAYNPDFVGNRFRLFLGRKTGEQGIKWEAKRLGFELTDRQVQVLLIKVKELLKGREKQDEQKFIHMLTDVAGS